MLYCHCDRPGCESHSLEGELIGTLTIGIGALPVGQKDDNPAADSVTLHFCRECGQSPQNMEALVLAGLRRLQQQRAELARQVEPNLARTARR